MRCEEVQELVPAYVLGALEEHERALVEAHLADCPQCATELRERADTMARLAELLPQEAPSPGLRVRLLRSLPPQETPAEVALRAPLRPPRRWWFPAAAAAVVLVAAAGLLAANLTLHSRVADVETKTQRLAVIETRLEEESQMLGSLNEQQKDLVAMLQQQRSLMYWLAIPGTRVAVVEPMPNLSRGYGLLLMPPDSSVAMLVVAGLSELPEGQSYHVWLLRGTERTSAGRFWPDPTGWAQAVIRATTPVLEFDRLRVTVEATPGSAAPSTPAIMQASLKQGR